MEIFIIVLVSSVLLNIFLIKRSIRIISELENLELNNFNFKVYVRDTLRNTLNTMKEIDERGSFESDDEVGAIFNELKATIDETTKLLLNETKEE
jgi:hypothetical protein